MGGWKNSGFHVRRALFRSGCRSSDSSTHRAQGLCRPFGRPDWVGLRKGPAVRGKDGDVSSEGAAGSLGQLALCADDREG